MNRSKGSKINHINLAHLVYYVSLTGLIIYLNNWVIYF